jgi:hypothetical protein
MDKEVKYKIEALIDQNLDPDETHNVINKIHSDPSCKQYFEQIMRTNHMLKTWWQNEKKKHH